MSATKKENASRGNNHERNRIEVSIEKSATLELRSEAASSLKLPGFYHENVCELHAEAGLNEGTPEALLTRGIVFLGSQAVQRILRLGSSSPAREIGAKRQIAIVAVRANNLHSQNVIHDGLASTTSFYFSTLQGWHLQCSTLDKNIRRYHDKHT